jgi:hypothetical protein
MATHSDWTFATVRIGTTRIAQNNIAANLAAEDGR